MLLLEGDPVTFRLLQVPVFERETEKPVVLRPATMNA